jgi:hypothetical protein
VKVRFLEAERQTISSLLFRIEETVKDRKTRRRIGMLRSKFETNASRVNVKRGELTMLAQIVEIALRQSEERGLTGERVELIKLVHASLKAVFAEQEKPVADANG